MVKLEEITIDAHLSGILNGEIVQVVQINPIGDDALTVIYRDSRGNISEQMLFRSDEHRLELATVGRPWSFDAPAEDFKLALEAYRISQAALFDPMMAVHTSNVDPYPHQISAVYEAMLPKQPLRFVLADDPGAGKTIMAGLLIRELLLRADARRILIVAPGSLTEQWQDELLEKFGLVFDIFSREKQEQSASGNFFDEANQLICRLDQLSRNEDYQEKLKATDWDIIIVDEAHKLSANYFGQKVNKTKRFQLGEMLSSITRHFLLMTATPHNGKEEDFQIWLSLLDGDRFYGRFREGAHKVDVSDMMRRMVKEDLLKFDGTPLFPERRAYTANYALSDAEAELYYEVTDYVRNEMNRADELLDGQRKGNVGFALTMLQRRLASSPEAIYQSLKRRRKRLEERLNEMKLLARGEKIKSKYGIAETLNTYSVTRKLDLPENLDEIDEELSAEEYEAWTDQVVDQATAAETIPELITEIELLKDLEHSALGVVQSGNDKKWEQLSYLLQDRPEMYDSSGNRRKLIIFTEHTDTLHYLTQRIRGLLGRPEAVVNIHGGVNRDDRRKVQEEFRNNPDVLVLVATDAAGEGVNLQNANLMVNYDLPWNPNRLEQRFGRIHRIGQTEVCHLWNLVASETREGDVFQRLFEKIEVEKKALGGKVFDVLGEAFEDRSLKDLLVEAIRYGESPEVKARLFEAIDNTLDTERLKEIIKRSALVEQHMPLEELYSIKEEMDKAEARRLQPHFVRSFFNTAFKKLNGELRQRESGRYEIRHVPASVRERDRVIGDTRTPVLRKYERICFEKEQVSLQGRRPAELVHPTHPLMASVTDLILSQHRSKLKQGAVLVAGTDESTTPKVLFMIEHTVREAGGEQPRSASKRLQFVTIDQHKNAEFAGWAPHLDLRPMEEGNEQLVEDVLKETWISKDLEALALGYASQNIVPKHYEEIKTRREKQATKTLAAVHERLIKEINYWSERSIKLREDIAAGKKPRIQPEQARRRAEELTERLKQRTHELEQMKNVVSSTPVVLGGALVIPQGLIDQYQGKPVSVVDAQARARIERIAMQAVFDHEHSLGNITKDVSAEKCGWDITAIPPMKDGVLPVHRHIEVKGRAKGQSTITVSHNEIKYAFNQGDKFWLAIVIVDGDSYEGPYYVHKPFTREPAEGETSINYDLNYLLSKANSRCES